MPLPALLLRALPLAREAACTDVGRRSIRRAVDFACAKDGSFLTRGLRRGLYYSSPLVPVACALGGGPAVDPLLDVVCGSPPDELEARVNALARQRGLGGVAGRRRRPARRGPPARLDFAGFFT